MLASFLCGRVGQRAGLASNQQARDFKFINLAPRRVQRKTDFYAEFMFACAFFTVFLCGRPYICNVGISLSYGDFNMKHIFDQTSARSGAADPLNDLCLSKRDHERALAYMRKADMLTDNIIRVGADIHAAIAWIERGVAELTRRIRAVLAKPAQN
jgi:hypothetical protein